MTMVAEVEAGIVNNFRGRYTLTREFDLFIFFHCATKQFILNIIFIEQIFTVHTCVKFTYG